MGHRRTALGMASAVLIGGLVLTGCGDSGEEEAAEPSGQATAAEGHAHEEGGGGHQHDADGGQPPEGIQEAADPAYAMGETVRLAADHMPGMDGAEATISGAFDTTTYAVSYTPTGGGEPVTGHQWVVHEELEDPGEAPLPDGTEVVLTADHMPGMDGARASVDSSTDETVYMVDFDMDGMAMTNHKWVVESEIRPVQ